MFIKPITQSSLNCLARFLLIAPIASLFILGSSCGHEQRVVAESPTITASAPAPLPKPTTPKPKPGDCAIIVTDDDIPSGSATAGALYVGEDELGRRLLTADVLSVAQGFRDAGYTCVEASDSHREALDAKFLTAQGIPVHTPDNEKTWKVPFIGPLGPQYRIAALVGFHAMASSKDGFRPHTVNDYVKSLTMNNREIGEVTIKAIGLQALGIPLVLVSGDHAAAAEAKAVSSQIETVAVRWRLPDGKVAFLSEKEAKPILREAARRAALKAAPISFAYPMNVTLSPGSVKRAQATLSQIKAEPMQSELSNFLKQINHPPYTFNPKVEGKNLSWSVPDGILAFETMVMGTVSCMLESTRQAKIWVRKGLDAYIADKHMEALAAYNKAIKIDPDDFSLRCRVGQVYSAQGKLKKARNAFQEGVDHIEEIINDFMKVVCYKGLANVLEKQGAPKKAILYLRRILELPNKQDSHKNAKEAILRLEEKTL